MRQIFAPNPVDLGAGDTDLFLGGSIEMGLADNWQEGVAEGLSDLPDSVVLVNPRRKDWDSNCDQSGSNHQFRQQVEWELRGLDLSEHVLFYFAPGTKSPISLMELGLCCARPHRVLVCCPDGFWRKGNVDILCQRYGVPMFDTLSSLLDRYREVIADPKSESLRPKPQTRSEKWAWAAEILVKHDPMGLIKMGAPEDEYDGEAERIVADLGLTEDSKAGIEGLVRNVFVSQFDANLARGIPSPTLTEALWSYSRTCPACEERTYQSSEGCWWCRVCGTTGG